jgi:hypothetical protein
MINTIIFLISRSESLFPKCIKLVKTSLAMKYDKCFGLRFPDTNLAKIETDQNLIA